MSIRFIFAWYDLWIGAYWDRERRLLYVFPVPMLGVVVGFPLAPRQVRKSERACCKMIEMTSTLSNKDLGQMRDYLNAVIDSRCLIVRNESSAKENRHP